MKAELILVGKSSPGWMVEGMNDYLNRLKFLFPLNIKEIRPENKLPKEIAVEREGKALLGAIDAKSWVVLLDEHGRNLSSTELAQLLQSRMLQSAVPVSFIIGGAFGVSEEVKKRADLTLSFSRMTFTHQMIRLLLLEQLYRAMTILQNKPYHHD